MSGRSLRLGLCRPIPSRLLNGCCRQLPMCSCHRDTCPAPLQRSMCGTHECQPFHFGPMRRAYAHHILSSLQSLCFDCGIDCHSSWSQCTARPLPTLLRSIGGADAHPQYYVQCAPRVAGSLRWDRCVHIKSSIVLTRFRIRSNAYKSFQHRPCPASAGLVLLRVDATGSLMHAGAPLPLRPS